MTQSEKTHGMILYCYLLPFLLAVLTIAIAILSKWHLDHHISSWSRDSSSQNVFSTARLGKFRHAAIAEDSGICSKIGRDILLVKGGSAVDAAIALAVCIGVINAHSSGVGGGHVMSIYAAPRTKEKKEIMSVFARGRAPAGATAVMFTSENVSSTLGGLSVSVPGEIKGFYVEWSRYGRVAWSDLFKPSINLCRNGFTINSALARALRLEEAFIRGQKGLRETFVKRDGSLFTEGDIIFRPKLAITLEKIAENPLAFYDKSSDLAKDIIADIKDHGGIISGSDLTDYRSYTQKALNITLINGDYTVFTPGPPAGGIVLQHILGILDGYFFSPSSVITTEDKITTYHRIIEAYKFAFGKMSSLADPSFNDIQDLIDKMTSREYSASIRSKIKDAVTQNVSFYQPVYDNINDAGTAHLSVLAADGSAVSLSSSINLRFGSKICGQRTGIIFNNEMDDFAIPGKVNFFGLPASPLNFIQPGKMPMSSMSPIIILDKSDKVRFLSGASGGSRIISTTAFVTMNILWFGMPLDIATGLHRFHHQLIPNKLCVEEGLDKEVLAGLRSKGHLLEVCGLAMSQSIHNTCYSEQINQPEHACIEAVSDGRKSGVPDGY